MKRSVSEERKRERQKIGDNSFSLINIVIKMQRICRLPRQFFPVIVDHQWYSRRFIAAGIESDKERIISGTNIHHRGS